MKLCSVWFLAACTAAMLVSPKARAKSFTLDYSAPRQCPSADDFQRELLARAATATRVEARPDFALLVRLTRRPAQVVLGSLRVTTPKEESSVRSVDGESCEEVVSALALIAALILDPNARIEPIRQLMPDSYAQGPVPTPGVATDASPAEGRADAVPDSAKTTGDPALKSGPTQTETERGQRAPHGFGSSSASKRSDSETRIPIWVSGTGHYGLGLAPRALAWLGFQVAMITPGGVLLELGGAWGPAQDRHDDQGEVAEFSYVGGRAVLGLPALEFGPFSARALLSGDSGRLNARGKAGGRIARPDQTSSFWLGVGPALRLGTRWGRFLFSAEAAVPLTLVRPRFEITLSDQRRVEFHSVPPAVVELGVQIAVLVFEALP